MSKRTYEEEPEVYRPSCTRCGSVRNTDVYPVECRDWCSYMTLCQACAPPFVKGHVFVVTADIDTDGLPGLELLEDIDVVVDEFSPPPDGSPRSSVILLLIDPFYACLALRLVLERKTFGLLVHCQLPRQPTCFGITLQCAILKTLLTHSPSCRPSEPWRVCGTALKHHPHLLGS